MSLEPSEFSRRINDAMCVVGLEIEGILMRCSNSYDQTRQCCALSRRLAYLAHVPHAQCIQFCEKVHHG